VRVFVACGQVLAIWSRSTPRGQFPAPRVCAHRPCRSSGKGTPQWLTATGRPRRGPRLAFSAAGATQPTPGAAWTRRAPPSPRRSAPPGVLPGRAGAPCNRTGGHRSRLRQDRHGPREAPGRLGPADALLGGDDGGCLLVAASLVLASELFERVHADGTRPELLVGLVHPALPSFPVIPKRVSVLHLARGGIAVALYRVVDANPKMGYSEIG
jgi:hypothetical protein